MGHDVQGWSAVQAAPVGETPEAEGPCGADLSLPEVGPARRVDTRAGCVERLTLVVRVTPADSPAAARSA
jgi:hypothetical protein